jgi:hypothetical protein
MYANGPPTKHSIIAGVVLSQSCIGAPKPPVITLKAYHCTALATELVAIAELANALACSVTVHTLRGTHSSHCEEEHYAPAEASGQAKSHCATITQ